MTLTQKYGFDNFVEIGSFEKVKNLYKKQIF